MSNITLKKQNKLPEFAFVKLSNNWIDDSLTKLSPKTDKIYLILATAINKQNRKAIKGYESNESLMPLTSMEKFTGLTKKTCISATKELIDNQILIKKHGTLTNTYTLTTNAVNENFTMFPINWVENLIKHMSSSDLRVLIAITRVTLGRYALSGQVPICTLKRMTKLQINTIKKSIRTLVNLGLIEWWVDNRKSNFLIKISNSNTPKKDVQSSKIFMFKSISMNQNLHYPKCQILHPLNSQPLHPLTNGVITEGKITKLNNLTNTYITYSACARDARDACVREEVKKCVGFDDVVGGVDSEDVYFTRKNKFDLMQKYGAALKSRGLEFDQVVKKSIDWIDQQKEKGKKVVNFDMCLRRIVENMVYPWANKKTEEEIKTLHPDQLNNYNRNKEIYHGYPPIAEMKASGLVLVFRKKEISVLVNPVYFKEFLESCVEEGRVRSWKRVEEQYELTDHGKIKTSDEWKLAIKGNEIKLDLEAMQLLGEVYFDAKRQVFDYRSPDKCQELNKLFSCNFEYFLRAQGETMVSAFEKARIEFNSQMVAKAEILHVGLWLFEFIQQLAVPVPNKKVEAELVNCSDVEQKNYKYNKAVYLDSPYNPLVKVKDRMLISTLGKGRDFIDAKEIFKWRIETWHKDYICLKRLQPSIQNPQQHALFGLQRIK